MKTIVHKANTRGAADHGWLKSYHSFSFASYHNPERMGFGALRVINDDQVAPSQGFGTHPHSNMEIISIPLSGALKHEDSEGNQAVIKNGEVQLMSAGTGVYHSEYNNSSKENVNFLQIWVMPKEQNIRPRYDQKAFDLDSRKNKFQTVVNPIGKGLGGVEINQDAYFSLADLDKGKNLKYKSHGTAQGQYLFILNGKVEIDSQTLETRDAMGITNASEFEIIAKENTQLLLMEVPTCLK